jgi:hypothetical protein
MTNTTTLQKEKTLNQNYSFDYSCIPFNSNAHLLLWAFRDRGVPGPTSEMSPHAPAQMGRREAEREGGK